MKAVSKHIVIDIEYIDRKDLEIVFKEILTELNSGKNFNRRVSGTSLYEYKKTRLEIPVYREEKINGKWCMIYESKMNKK